jgi:hypothetical protein
LVRPKPAVHAAKVIGKNALGVLLVAIGVVLSIPGVPGQGLLTILLGVMLLDFPGKPECGTKTAEETVHHERDHEVEKKFGKPPLELD